MATVPRVATRYWRPAAIRDDRRSMVSPPYDGRRIPWMDQKVYADRVNRAITSVERIRRRAKEIGDGSGAFTRQRRPA